MSIKKNKKFTKFLMFAFMISTMQVAHPFSFNTLTNWGSSCLSSISETVVSSFNSIKSYSATPYVLGAFIGSTICGIPLYYQWKQAKKAKIENDSLHQELGKKCCDAYEAKEENKVLRELATSKDQEIDDLKLANNDLLKDQEKKLGLIAKHARNNEWQKNQITALRRAQENLDTALKQEQEKRSRLEEANDDLLARLENRADQLRIEEGPSFSKGEESSEEPDCSRIAELLDTSRGVTINKDQIMEFFDGADYISLEQAIQLIERGGKLFYLIHDKTCRDEFRKYCENLDEESYLKHINDLAFFLYSEAILRGEAFKQGTYVLEDESGELNDFLMNYVHKVNEKVIQDGPILLSWNDKAYKRKATHFMGEGFGVDIDRLSDEKHRLPDDKPHLLFGHTDTTKTRIYLKPEDHGLYIWDAEGFIRHALGLGKAVGRRLGLWGSNEEEGMRKEHFPAAYAKAVAEFKEQGILSEDCTVASIAEFYVILQDNIHAKAQELYKEIAAKYRHPDKRKGQEVYFTINDLLPSAYGYYASEAEISGPLVDHLSRAYNVYQEIVNDLQEDNTSNIFKKANALNVGFTEMPEAVHNALQARYDDIMGRIRNCLGKTMANRLADSF